MVAGLLGCAALLLAGVPARATNYTWTAGSGTWDDATPANWSPAGIPANADSVALTQPGAGAATRVNRVTGSTGSHRNK
jgi:hypothetical protein